MYQRSSHEPRYKQSTRARELRHAESNEYSEISSSSEEEESIDRCTEESEESIGTLSYQLSSQEKFLDRRSSPCKSYNCEKFYISSYIPSPRVSKRDKFTQKNLLSPFPSYWETPIQKEVTGITNYRVSNVMPIPEEQPTYATDEKLPKKRGSCQKNDDFSNRYYNEVDKNWEKHKFGKDKYLPKSIKPEEVSRDSREISGKLLKPLIENFSKSFGGGLVSRRPNTSIQENDFCSQTSKTCPDCLAMVENRSKSKRKSVGAASCEKEPKSQDIVCSKDIGDGKLSGKKKGKEVKEKLVYVVEEEGKDATKIETDIFSLNEILAIKKDLIELSEFAKKLKRLKEMKKDIENDQNKKSSCHCHNAEELLKDVNKRIEILEARQEELEKKSLCYQKMDTTLPHKKLIKSKPLSPPKTPVLTHQSAAATVPSDPKKEMLETRVEGFTCNSDIVNELMDIKIQLEKLEKKRMLKQVSNETVPEKEETYLTKTKEHAIAVFSSRTYILTAENFDKMQSANANVEKSKKDLMKENVRNWLRNVSLERADKEANAFLSTDSIRKESVPEQEKKIEEAMCRNCFQVSKPEDLKNQARAFKNIKLQNAGGGERGLMREKAFISANGFLCLDRR